MLSNMKIDKTKEINLNDLNYVIKILNLIYKFNDLVKFIKKYRFEKYFKRSNSILYMKYPEWERIFIVLDYFAIYILNENEKKFYINFINSYKNNTNLKIYYENLINS